MHAASRGTMSRRNSDGEAVAIFAEIGGEDGEMQPEVWKLVEW